MGKPIFLSTSDNQLVTALFQTNEAAVRHVFESEAYLNSLDCLYSKIIKKHRCRLTLKKLRESFLHTIMHNNFEMLHDYEADPSRLEVWITVKAQHHFKECGLDHDETMARSIACLDKDKQAQREIDTNYVFRGKEYKSLFESMHRRFVLNNQIEYDDMVQDLFCHLGKDNYKNLLKYSRKEGFFDDWLFIVGRNYLWNLISKKTETMKEVRSDDDDVFDGVSEFMHETDMRMDIEWALPQLPQKYQDLIQKMFYEDKEADVIAQEMGGKNRTYTDTLKFRVLAKLAQLLASYSSNYERTGEKKTMTV